jgi:hypothetical protein
MIENIGHSAQQNPVDIAAPAEIEYPCYAAHFSAGR